MRRGFFLLMELFLGLLVFFSVVSFSYAPSSHALSYVQVEIACHDLLSVWLYGGMSQGDLENVARGLLPQGVVTFSSQPIPSSFENAFTCHASRHVANGVVEELYIFIES